MPFAARRRFHRPDAAFTGRGERPPNSCASLRDVLLTFAVIKKRAFAGMEILRYAQNDVSCGASGGYVTLSEDVLCVCKGVVSDLCPQVMHNELSRE